MGKLEGRVAWVTGGGTGIGEAAAMALASEGAQLVLTGRRLAPLEEVAGRIKAAGGAAHVKAADVTDAAAVQGVADWTARTLGRLDIFVANAGLNILERGWDVLTPSGADTVLHANLDSVFYGAIAVLPIMRRQREGQIIVTASMAGRWIGLLSGPAYVAAKHGVVAACHTINMQECVNGIRCTAVLPGEVATPILDMRPVPVSAEDRARMAQKEDVGDLIRYVACLPPHVVINEVTIAPTWNRGYVAGLPRSQREARQASARH
jgi:NADP-dependent 3-hydroxy acid dehydrogenase YdfG